MTNPRSSSTPPIVGLPRYETRWDKVRHFHEKTLPEHIETAHAVDPRSRPIASPTFLETWQDEHALCGVRMKILLALAFEASDPAACPRCAEHLAKGTAARHRPRREPLVRTARTTYSGTEGEEIHWATCNACAYVGPDRKDEDMASDDAEVHNREKHAGALEDVDRSW